MRHLRVLRTRVHACMHVQELASQTTSLNAKLAESESGTAKLRGELKKAQDYIGQLMNERSEIEKKFHSMKEDLITRLTNACNQRDEARENVSGMMRAGKNATRGSRAALR